MHETKQAGASSLTYYSCNKATLTNGVLIWGTEPALQARQQSLKAFSADRDGGAVTSSIGTTVQVSNQGNTAVSYKDITVRYWFTSDGSQPLLYQLDYANMGQLGVTSRFMKLFSPLPGADTYLELGFAAADSLYPFLRGKRYASPIDGEIRIERAK